jgi:hypothetical protein
MQDWLICKIQQTDPENGELETRSRLGRYSTSRPELAESRQSMLKFRVSHS